MLLPAHEIQSGRRLPDDPLAESLGSLSIELTRISAEIQSINSGFQAQFQQALADTRHAVENHYRAQLESSVAEVRMQLRTEIVLEVRKDFEAELNRRFSHLKAVQEEIARASAQLDVIANEVATMLDDPAVELSKVMRKRAEQSELKAYLRGLRYFVGEPAESKKP